MNDYIARKTYMQVFAMPVFDMLERMMMKRLNFPPGVLLRIVARSAYVGEIPTAILGDLIELYVLKWRILLFFVNYIASHDGMST